MCFMFYILIIDNDRQILHTKPREPDLKCTQPSLAKLDMTVGDAHETQPGREINCGLASHFAVYRVR